MESKLKEFLINLGKSRDYQEAFKRDPEAEMDRAGLTSEEKDAVRKQDSARISALIGEDLPDSFVMVLSPIDATDADVD